MIYVCIMFMYSAYTNDIGSNESIPILNIYPQYVQKMKL